MRRLSRLVTVIKHLHSAVTAKHRLLRRVPSTSVQSCFTAQERDELKIRVTVGVFPQGDRSKLRKASRRSAGTSAVHVSLSSDSLFKQPGDLRDPHLRKARRVVEAHASEYNRMPFHCSSEELQRRVIAPTTSGWRADGRYIGFGLKPCQPQINRVLKT